MAKKEQPPEPKKGAPAYMVSFGDMMTLILCFFILLVSMAQEQNFGLLAQGLGSFIVAIESHGLNGTMSGQEQQAIFDNVRRRFNLPPEDDPERQEAHLDAANLELFRAEALEALEPLHELFQPRVAVFAADSAALSVESRTYLDRLADSLRPARGQVLALEGHANDAGVRFDGDNRWLAFRRAEEVRRYLVDHLSFLPERVVARGWAREILTNGSSTRSVDARLTTPKKK